MAQDSKKAAVPGNHPPKLKPQPLETPSVPPVLIFSAADSALGILRLSMLCMPARSNLQSGPGVQ